MNHFLFDMCGILWFRVIHAMNWNSWVICYEAIWLWQIVRLGSWLDASGLEPVPADSLGDAAAYRALRLEGEIAGDWSRHSRSQRIGYLHGRLPRLLATIVKRSECICAERHESALPVQPNHVPSRAFCCTAIFSVTIHDCVFRNDDSYSHPFWHVKREYWGAYRITTSGIPRFRLWKDTTRQRQHEGQSRLQLQTNSLLLYDVLRKKNAKQNQTAQMIIMRSHRLNLESACRFKQQYFRD